MPLSTRSCRQSTAAADFSLLFSAEPVDKFSGKLFYKRFQPAELFWALHLHWLAMVLPEFLAGFGPLKKVSQKFLFLLLKAGISIQMQRGIRSFER